jgi:glutaredoxin 3
MQIKQFLIILPLMLTVNTALAVNIYECEDNNGNIAFQDRCPPSTKRVNERNYSTGSTDNSGGNVALTPLTLYSVPNCDTCNQLKEFLQIRNIGYSEIDVSSDIELQIELKDRAGELQVPALVVGDKVLLGYNRTELRQTLTQAGYISE